MELGAFSVSLSVKDLQASRGFNEKLGFSPFGGNADEGWLIMKNGDAVIGINPATDSTTAVTTLIEMLHEIIQRYNIPTQSCVLTHVTTSIAAINTNSGVFGSSANNNSPEVNSTNMPMRKPACPSWLLMTG